MFGDFVREKRLEVGLANRAFCDAIHFDYSQWNRIERGLEPPPKDRAVLKTIGDVIQLQTEEDWNQLFDLAMEEKAVNRRSVSDSEATAALPVCFRAPEDKPLTPETVKKMKRFIKEAYS
jgi:hypothetical protein